MGLAAFFILPLLLPTIWSGQLQQYLPPQLRTYFAPAKGAKETIVAPSEPSLLESCKTHSYTTEIVSLDPLVIYINNFTSPAEAEALIKLG